MMLPLAGPLHAAGYAVLLFDARNHGRSDDEDFSSLPRFAEDLEHAVDWLCRRDEVDAGRIAVLGHSVGAGAALLLASRRPDLAAVVSLSAFAHPSAMMRRWLKARRIPYWPLGAYILHYVQRVIGRRFDDIAPSRTIRGVHCPVLLAHGLEDDLVPVSEAQEIYARRRDERVRLLLMPGSHDEYREVDRHIGAVIGFLDRALATAAPTDACKLAATSGAVP
jgi:pimeloyl-ACP methyl ester carboxylesterase